ncbi:MAG: adenylate kinase family protein [Halobacteriales archaeon]
MTRRVAVTGTPGTGKTTATGRLETDRRVVHLNDVIREHGLIQGHDDERDTAVVDIDAVDDWLADAPADAVVESHLAHRFPADRVVVLRAHPETIESRLRDRGEPETTVRENAESEALDTILGAAVERHGRDRIYEVDTTDRTPELVAEEIDAVMRGERDPSAGTVSFTGYIHKE